MFKFNVKTTEREQLIDITPQIIDVIRRGSVKEGVIVVFVPHTTACLTVNENSDPAVRSDIVNFLKKSIPYKNNYDHMEGNSDAHIKSSYFGNSASFIISEGDLVLGRWQDIFFCEFDGPRNREVYCQIIGK